MVERLCAKSFPLRGVYYGQILSIIVRSSNNKYNGIIEIAIILDYDICTIDNIY